MSDNVCKNIQNCAGRSLTNLEGTVEDMKAWEISATKE